MDILPYEAGTRNKKIVCGMTILMLVAMAFVAIVGVPAITEADEPAPQIMELQPTALKPGQREGEHDLNENPAEYYIEGNMYEYFGAKMLKLDINGDGVLDLAVTRPYFYGQSVVIFDGATQVMFPDLQSTSSSARWNINFGGDWNNYYFGTDIAVGDVNGDGYDDILVGSAYYQYSAGYLFYGGPQWNSRSSVPLQNADVSFQHTQYSNYMGKGTGIGDIDGDGYDDVILCAPGNHRAFIWYGANNLNGTKLYTTRDLEIYSLYIGGSGVSTGDMNGDGQDDVVFATPFQSGSPAIVFYPGSNIRSTSSLTAGSTSTFAKWQLFKVTGSYAGGYPVNIQDYNGDGLADLFIGAPAYQTGWVYIVNGRTSFTEGSLDLYRATVYDNAFYTSAITGSVQYYNAYFGSHTLGDYDGDGKLDLMIGCSNPKKVYVILHDDFNNTKGPHDVEEIATLIIKGQSGGSQSWGGPGYYAFYFYYYYPNYGQLQFWDRDGDGLEEIFISDSMYNPGNKWSAGAVFGITPFNMVEPGPVEVMSGDLPDGKTFYGEYRYYGMKASVINRWDPTATESVTFKFNIGFYSAEYEYTPDEGMNKISDPLNIMHMDMSRLNISYDFVESSMIIEIWVKFTLNMTVEFPVELETTIKIAHIVFKSSQEIGKVKLNFKYVGELRAFNYDETLGKQSEVKRGDWFIDGKLIMFEGPRLIYNGTDNFMKDFAVEPYSPGNHLFRIVGTSSLNEEAFDDSSSGRNFSIIMHGGDLPLTVEYQFRQVGLTSTLLLNSIPGFYINIDVDTPSAPSGIRVRSNSFTDENTIVDNDGILYVTWTVPAEYNSGISHYEIEVTGIEGILTATNNFIKVETPASGLITVGIRALDRVGHIGPWGYGTILVEKEGVGFMNPVPSSDIWHNTYTPDVGYTITDIGGRFVVGTTVEYSVSLDAGVTWSPWSNAEMMLNAKDLEAIINPVLVEGSDNMVKFRATDEAGNSGESDPINVKVDVSGVMFKNINLDELDDWEGRWIPDGNVVVTFEASDMYSGVDPSTVEYRYSTRGRADLETAEWMGKGSLAISEGLVTLPEIEFAQGDRNFIQFRARDMAGNPTSYSRAYNILVNTAPTPVISSPENGLEVLEGTSIRFDATMTRDMDGDSLTFTWIDQHTVGDEMGERMLGEGAPDPARFDMVLEPGSHAITLRVSDGIHTVEVGPVNVEVIARIVPIWLSDEDTDGDGMPNIFEYIYNLGWDDPTNGDSTYTDSMKGKSKEEIWSMVKDDYVSRRVQVTEANDFDGDGFTDFEEYLHGTNPTDPLDFPRYVGEGREAEDRIDILLVVLIVLAIVVMILLIVILTANSMAMKKKVEEEGAKAAQEEELRVQQLLESGGNMKLQALKAASEGKAAPALPAPEGSIIPGAEPVAAPMTAQPVSPAPIEGWVAAPIAAPQSGDYANVNTVSDNPPV